MYLILSKEKIQYEDIEKVESTFSIQFPDSYKDFLLLNNGGQAAISDPRIIYALFFAIADGTRNLRNELHENKKYGFIPIGMNLNQDFIYINLNTKEVVLNDEVIANSFEEFVHKFLSASGS